MLGFSSVIWQRASQSGGAPRRFSIYAVIFAAMLAAALFFRRKSPNLLLKRADFPIGILMAADGLLPRIAIDCLRRQEVRARDALSQSPDRRHYGGRLDRHRLFGAGRRAARPRAVRRISGTGLRRPHRAHVRLSGYPGARDGELHDGTPAPSGLKGPSVRMRGEQSPQPPIGLPWSEKRFKAADRVRNGRRRRHNSLTRIRCGRKRGSPRRATRIRSAAAKQAAPLPAAPPVCRL